MLIENNYKSACKYQKQYLYLWYRKRLTKDWTMAFKYRGFYIWKQDRGCWCIGVENDFTPVDAANTRSDAKTMVDRWVANEEAKA